MRASTRFIAFACGSAFLAACTSLLGDFSAGSGGSDGGGDGAPAEEGGPEGGSPDTSLSDGMSSEGAVDSGALDGSPGAEAGDARVDAPTGPTYSPPTITPVSDQSGGPGIDRTGPAITISGSDILVAFDDQDNANISQHYDSWALSTNGGTSFTDEGPFPNGAVYDQGYASVGRDQVSNHVYLTTNANTASFQSNELALMISTNGGTSFNPAINAADPTLSTSDFVDISSVAVDNAAGQGQGVVYVAYGDYGGSIDIHMSTYSGGTFAYSTPANLGGANQASLPWVTVGPNHYVYLAFYGVTGTTPGVYITRSTNQAVTFSTPAVVTPLHMPFVAGAYNGSLGLEGETPDGGATPVGLYASPQVVTNPVSGAVYIAYADATQGADKANIYFTHSEDGAVTWAAPVQVNDDATTHDQFLPSIAVTPDGTRLAIAFYDRRNDANNVGADRYAASAAIAGSTITFGKNFRISKATFPVLTETGGSTGFFCIHTGMAADATYFYDVYPDAIGGNLDVELAKFGIDF